jgi:tRNA(fMet)-specific endonuclease VapC
MIVLDTDHLSVLLDERDSRRERLEEAFKPIACTIVSSEEILRGWLAALHKRHDIELQVPAYTRLRRLFATMADWDIIPFEQAAAQRFRDLRRQRVRIGTMDLKIARFLAGTGIALRELAGAVTLASGKRRCRL